MRFPLLALLPAAALLLAAGESAAQTSRAQLRVLVSDTLGRPVANAQVTVNGVGAPARTDSTGTALVGDIPLGTRMITVWRLGFGEERAVLQFPQAATYRLPVVLTPRALALDSLLVEGERYVRTLERNGFYKRRRQGLGSFVSGERMEAIAAASPDLRRAFQLMPGFQVIPGRFGSSFVLNTGRGDTSMQQSGCMPAVVIDGRRADMEELASLPPQHVEAIEAYRGPAGAPVEYSFGESLCGLVLVWLKK